MPCKASVTTDFIRDGVESVSPTGVYGSHGGSGDRQTPVLVELLRQVSPLCSEEPEDILPLFVRLGEIYDLPLCDDRVFITRILPLASGSLLKFWGIACVGKVVGRL